MFSLFCFFFFYSVHSGFTLSQFFIFICLWVFFLCLVCVDVWCAFVVDDCSLRVYAMCFVPLSVFARSKLSSILAPVRLLLSLSISLFLFFSLSSLSQSDPHGHHGAL